MHYKAQNQGKNKIKQLPSRSEPRGPFRIPRHVLFNQDLSMAGRPPPFKGGEPITRHLPQSFRLFFGLKFLKILIQKKVSSKGLKLIS